MRHWQPRCYQRNRAFQCLNPFGASIRTLEAEPREARNPLSGGHGSSQVSRTANKDLRTTNNSSLKFARRCHWRRHGISSLLCANRCALGAWLTFTHALKQACDLSQNFCFRSICCAHDGRRTSSSMPRGRMLSRILAGAAVLTFVPAVASCAAPQTNAS